MATLGELAVKITADTMEFQRQMDSLGKKLGTLGGQMESAGKAATVGLTLPLAAVGGVAFKAAKDVDRAMATIARSTGATGAQLREFTDNVRNIWGTVPQGAEEIAQALGDLNTRLGLVGTELEETTRKALDFARVTEQDIGQATRNMGQLMNALRLDVTGAGDLMDYMVVAAEKTGIAVGDLQRAVIEAGPAFEELGYGVKESIALFAQFERVGARPQELLSSMNITLRRLAEQGATDVGTAFRQLLSDIERAPTLMDAVRIGSDAFGRHAAKLAEDIREGNFAVEEMVALLSSEAPGALDRAAKATLTFGEEMTMMRQEVLKALEPLGRAMMDVVRQMMPVFKAIIGLLAGVVRAFESLPKPVQSAVVATLALVAAIGPILFIGGKIISAVGGMVTAYGALVPVILKLVPAVKALMVAFAAHPVILIAIATIGSLIFIMRRLDISLADVLSGIRNFFGSAGRWISHFSDSGRRSILGFVETTKGAFSDWSRTIQRSIRRVVTELNRSLGGFAERIIQSFRRMTTQVTRMVQRFGQSLWDHLVSPLTRIRDQVNRFVDNVIGSFDRMFMRIVGGSIVPDMVRRVRAQFRLMSDDLVHQSERVSSSLIRVNQRISDSYLEFSGRVSETLSSIMAARSRFAAGTVSDPLFESLTRSESALNSLAGAYSQAQGVIRGTGTHFVYIVNGVDRTNGRISALGETVRQFGRNVVNTLSLSGRAIAAHTKDWHNLNQQLVSEIDMSGMQQGIVPEWLGVGWSRIFSLAIFRKLDSAWFKTVRNFHRGSWKIEYSLRRVWKQMLRLWDRQEALSYRVDRALIRYQRGIEDAFRRALPAALHLTGTALQRVGSHIYEFAAATRRLTRGAGGLNDLRIRLYHIGWSVQDFGNRIRDVASAMRRFGNLTGIMGSMGQRALLTIGQVGNTVGRALSRQADKLAEKLWNMGGQVSLIKPLWNAASSLAVAPRLLRRSSSDIFNAVVSNKTPYFQAIGKALQELSSGIRYQVSQAVYTFFRSLSEIIRRGRKWIPDLEDIASRYRGLTTSMGSGRQSVRGMTQDIRSQIHHIRMLRKEGFGQPSIKDKDLKRTLQKYFDWHDLDDFTYELYLDLSGMPPQKIVKWLQGQEQYLSGMMKRGREWKSLLDEFGSMREIGLFQQLAPNIRDVIASISALGFYFARVGTIIGGVSAAIVASAQKIPEFFTRARQGIGSLIQRYLDWRREAVKTRDEFFKGARGTEAGIIEWLMPGPQAFAGLFRLIGNAFRKGLPALISGIGSTMANLGTTLRNLPVQGAALKSYFGEVAYNLSNVGSRFMEVGAAMRRFGVMAGAIGQISRNALVKPLHLWERRLLSASARVNDFATRMLATLGTRLPGDNLFHSIGFAAQHAADLLKTWSSRLARVADSMFVQKNFWGGGRGFGGPIKVTHDDIIKFLKPETSNWAVRLVESLRTNLRIVAQETRLTLQGIGKELGVLKFKDLIFGIPRALGYMLDGLDRAMTRGGLRLAEAVRRAIPTSLDLLGRAFVTTGSKAYQFGLATRDITRHWVRVTRDSQGVSRALYLIAMGADRTRQFVTRMGYAVLDSGSKMRDLASAMRQFGNTIGWLGSQGTEWLFSFTVRGQNAFFRAANHAEKMAKRLWEIAETGVGLPTLKLPRTWRRAWSNTPWGKQHFSWPDFDPASGWYTNLDYIASVFNRVAMGLTKMGQSIAYIYSSILGNYRPLFVTMESSFNVFRQHFRLMVQGVRSELKLLFSELWIRFRELGLWTRIIPTGDMIGVHFRTLKAFDLFDLRSFKHLFGHIGEQFRKVFTLGGEGWQWMIRRTTGFVAGLSLFLGEIAVKATAVGLAIAGAFKGIPAIGGRIRDAFKGYLEWRRESAERSREFLQGAHASGGMLEWLTPGPAAFGGLIRGIRGVIQSFMAAGRQFWKAPVANTIQAWGSAIQRFGSSVRRVSVWLREWTLETGLNLFAGSHRVFDRMLDGVWRLSIGLRNIGSRVHDFGVRLIEASSAVRIHGVAVGLLSRMELPKLIRMFDTIRLKLRGYAKFMDNLGRSIWRKSPEIFRPLEFNLGRIFSEMTPGPLVHMFRQAADLLRTLPGSQSIAGAMTKRVQFGDMVAEIKPPASNLYGVLTELMSRIRSQVPHTFGLVREAFRNFNRDINSTWAHLWVWGNILQKVGLTRFGKELYETGKAMRDWGNIAGALSRAPARMVRILNTLEKSIARTAKSLGKMFRARGEGDGFRVLARNASHHLEHVNNSVRVTMMRLRGFLRRGTLPHPGPALRDFFGAIRKEVTIFSGTLREVFSNSLETVFAVPAANLLQRLGRLKPPRGGSFLGPMFERADDLSFLVKQNMATPVNAMRVLIRDFVHYAVLRIREISETWNRVGSGVARISTLIGASFVVAREGVQRFGDSVREALREVSKFSIGVLFNIGRRFSEVRESIRPDWGDAFFSDVFDEPFQVERWKNPIKDWATDVGRSIRSLVNQYRTWRNEQIKLRDEFFETAQIGVMPSWLGPSGWRAGIAKLAQAFKTLGETVKTFKRGWDFSHQINTLRQWWVLMREFEGKNPFRAFADIHKLTLGRFGSVKKQQGLMPAVEDAARMPGPAILGAWTTAIGGVTAAVRGFGDTVRNAVPWKEAFVQSLRSSFPILRDLPRIIADVTEEMKFFREGTEQAGSRLLRFYQYAKTILPVLQLMDPILSRVARSQQQASRGTVRVGDVGADELEEIAKSFDIDIGPSLMELPISPENLEAVARGFESARGEVERLNLEIHTLGSQLEDRVITIGQYASEVKELQDNLSEAEDMMSLWGNAFDRQMAQVFRRIEDVSESMQELSQRISDILKLQIAPVEPVPLPKDTFVPRIPSGTEVGEGTFIPPPVVSVQDYKKAREIFDQYRELHIDHQHALASPEFVWASKILARVEENQRRYNITLGETARQVNNVRDLISKWMQSLIAGAMGDLKGAPDPLVAIIGSVFDQSVQSLLNVIQPVDEAIGRSISALLNGLAPAIEIVTDLFDRVLGPLLHATGEILAIVLTPLKAIATALLPILRAMMEAILPIIKVFGITLAIITAAIAVFAGGLLWAVGKLLQGIGWALERFGAVTGALLGAVLLPAILALGKALWGLFSTVMKLIAVKAAEIAVTMAKTGAEAGKGIGGFIGGLIGSIGGPAGAVIGAGIGMAIGGFLGGRVGKAVGDVGRDIEALGKELLDFAAGIDDIVKEILGVGLVDSLADLEDAVSGATAAMRNVPSGFKLALRRFQADLGRGPGGDTVRTLRPLPPRRGATPPDRTREPGDREVVNVEQTFYVNVVAGDRDPREIWKGIKKEIAKDRMRGGATNLILGIP